MKFVNIFFNNNIETITMSSILTVTFFFLKIYLTFLFKNFLLHKFTSNKKVKLYNRINDS